MIFLVGKYKNGSTSAPGYEITEWRDFGTKALRQKCVKKHGKAEGL